MKVTVLVDNNTLIDRCYWGEPGVSFYIQDGDTKVLFDTGYSDIFIKNAKKLNINLLDTDYIVLSHGHYDHTWGLDPLVKLHIEGTMEKVYMKRPSLVAHPAVFQTRIVDDLNEIGCLVSEEKLSRHFDIELSSKPLWLTDRLVFLGEIERQNDFENKKPIGKVIKDGIEEDDYIIDDSALVYKSSKGLVIITGCSHSGICNITEYAKKVCQDDRIVDIIGGLHLLKPSKEQLQGTLRYMENLKPCEIHACHCTDLNSKIALASAANLKETGSGLILQFED